MPDLNQLEVSVIIPVYNAEPFLRKAVEAAELHEVVKEIILVEDKSPDNSWDLCLQLQKEYPKVKAFQHPDKANHGCGATRNYGLTLASYEYVTFADADNFILPNRYDKDQEIFDRYPDAEGVYNCMGVYYYSESSKELFLNTVNQEVLTFSEPVDPDEVPLVFLAAHPDKIQGSWGIDALTIKKSLFGKSGVFNTELKLQQDVDLFIKMSLVGRFYPGELEKETCIRGVHDQQRSTNNSQMDKYRLERWRSISDWLMNKPQVKNEHKGIFKQKYYSFLIRTSPKYKAFIHYLLFVLSYPSLIKEPYSFFDLNFWEVFGKNTITLKFISLKNRLISK